MKQVYELAEMEILSYCDEDVISTSMEDQGIFNPEEGGNETGWDDLI